MAISRTRMNVLEKAARIYGRDKHIDFYAECDYGTMAVKYGINWPALGTVDPDTTCEFAETLKQMAKVAREVNRLELEYDWDLDDPQIKTKEDAAAQAEQLAEWFKEGRSAKIARFMEEGDVR